jgi:hypothetical protein
MISGIHSAGSWVNSRSDLHVLEKTKTSLLTLPGIKLPFNMKLSLFSISSTD